MSFKDREYQQAWADSEELFSVDTGDWRAERPVVKASKCCHCGACYLFCPTGSIKDIGNHFEADLTYCKGCGICARECPVNAIRMLAEVRNEE